MDNPLGPVPGYSVVTRGDWEEANSEADGRAVCERRPSASRVATR